MKTEAKPLTTDEKKNINQMIEKAYEEGLNNYAYYLELCLSTDSLPR